MPSVAETKSSEGLCLTREDDDNPATRRAVATTVDRSTRQTQSLLPSHQPPGGFGLSQPQEFGVARGTSNDPECIEQQQQLSGTPRVAGLQGGATTVQGRRNSAGDSSIAESAGHHLEKPTICMVSDYFYPGLGGVENHIYQVAICLIARGHKVVVVTHSRRNRHGVRVMPCGLKVYYFPFIHMYESCIFPTIYDSFPFFREVCVREGVDIVHGHQAPSTMTHECIGHARAMGLHTVFTDHSLYSFGDAGSIHMNKVLKFWLTNVDHAICVSHTNKENLVLRASLPPQSISVIPNALDAARFKPRASTPEGPIDPPEIIRVCVVSRLTYRKGIDLLIDCIPRVCKACPNVKFIIGGDGPKRIQLEEMRERYSLHDSVTFLGSIPHDEVCEVLSGAHIFLNASLTEAFCIAIVEAACTGLLVVATEVGGVPEVLPPHLVTLTGPTGEALADGVIRNVKRVERGELNPWQMHRQVLTMYSWPDVARRTAKVYDLVLQTPAPTVAVIMRRLFQANTYSAYLFAFVVITHYLWVCFWCWWRPVEDIDLVPHVTNSQFNLWQKVLKKRKAEVIT